MQSTPPSKTTFLGLTMSQLTIPIVLLVISTTLKKEPKPGPLGDFTLQALYMAAGVMLLGSMALAITKLKWPNGPTENPAATLRAGFNAGVMASSFAELAALMAFISVFLGWITAIQAMPMIVGTMVAILGVALPRGLAFLSEGERKL